MRLKRIFYPVGQGAYYSEMHYIDSANRILNVIYDCGNSRRLKRVGDLVSLSIKDIKEIDILFISHFDYDHISYINILANKKIKMVVLPLLDENEKRILSLFYTALNRSWVTLMINNPETYFGNDTKVIYVEDIIKEEITNENSDFEYDMLTSGQKIPSGSKIKFGYWTYIPYNYRYDERHDKLIELMKEQGFDIDFFQSEHLDEILRNRKKNREIYNKLEGKINQNSMLVASILIPANLNSRYFARHSDENSAKRNSPIGCLYTGDADLNKTDVKSRLSSYWDLIGTIQIPHHGDKNSFNKDYFEVGKFFSPVSFGEKNNYGHPSFDVLYQLLKARAVPILITENLSEYIQEYNILILT